MEEFTVELSNVTKTFAFEKSKGLYSVLKNFQNPSKVRKTLIALDNVSLNIKKGEVFAIIGLNGSGKTTLLRTIAGIYKPDNGTIKINGKLSPLLKIGAGFHEELKAKENIIISGMFMGFSKQTMKNKIDKIMEYAELKEFYNMKLKHYSSGMRTRLGFSTALHLEPDIILADEILAVGDIGFREKCFDTFRSLKKQGKTIIYTTHNLGSLPNFSDRVLLINYGKVVMIDQPEKTIEKFKEIVRNRKR